MKILGFADKKIVKDLLRDANINPVSVRKVIIGSGYIDVFFHDNSNMRRIDSPYKLIERVR